MEVENRDITAFVNRIKSISKYDFTGYSVKSLKRRFSKILLDRELDPPALLEKLDSDPNFLEDIVKDITVNTTEMFRDPSVWHSLRYDILPGFQDRKGINVWHPGCSTGQEVYSMMILLNELGLLQKANLFGTDINSDVLETARKGIYKYRFNEIYLNNFDTVIRENPRDNNSYFNVPYSKYFNMDRTRDKISMNKQLLEKGHYINHDLVTDPNPSDKSYDLVVCRNVIIYFNYELQNKVFKLFLDNMNKGACLLLGVHESILGPYASRFDKKHQAYFKR